MPRQVFALEYRQQGLPRAWIQAVHMVQLHLVEKGKLARHRMAQHRAATLTNPQVVVANPFTGDSLLPALFLDSRAVISLKEMLPAHVEAVSEVADVHQALLLELLANLGFKPVVDLAA